METTNDTTVTYFILKGISGDPRLQVPIFLLVLVIYLITLSGNMTILLLVCWDRQLHTPMYFFLGNLSIMDMSSITITLHKVLSGFTSGDNTISFLGCMTQYYIFSSVTCDELLLLTAMSYDRYVAICNPLLYYAVMNHRVCGLLATICYVIGFIEVFPYLLISMIAGRYKAFYTCSSHITVVLLLYVMLICQYLNPSSMDSLESNKLFSLFNTAAVPLLNPLIYSLKNEAVKTAFSRTFL
ncbi:olfactory receptor 8A1-like [Discoglossus pictus]